MNGEQRKNCKKNPLLFQDTNSDELLFEIWKNPIYL